MNAKGDCWSKPWILRAKNLCRISRFSEGFVEMSVHSSQPLRTAGATTDFHIVQLNKWFMPCLFKFQLNCNSMIQCTTFLFKLFAICWFQPFRLTAFFMHHSCFYYNSLVSMCTSLTPVRLEVPVCLILISFLLATVCVSYCFFCCRWWWILRSFS